MLTVVLSWLGGSVIWLVPLIIVQIAHWAMRNGAPGGQGTLRVWAGGVLAYAASSCLESLVTSGIAAWPHGGVLGRGLAGLLVETIGHPLSISLSLIALIGALPLYIKGIRTRVSALLGADGADKSIATRSARTSRSSTSASRPGLSPPTGRGRSDGRRIGASPFNPSGASGAARKPVMSAKPGMASPHKKDGQGRSPAVSTKPPLAKSYSPSPGPRPSAASAQRPTQLVTQKASGPGTGAKTAATPVPSPKPPNPVAYATAATIAANRTALAPRGRVSEPLPPPSSSGVVRNVPVRDTQTESVVGADWYEPVSVDAAYHANQAVLPEEVQATLDAIARRAAEWAELSLGDGRDGRDGGDGGDGGDGRDRDRDVPVDKSAHSAPVLGPGVSTQFSSTQAAALGLGVVNQESETGDSANAPERDQTWPAPAPRTGLDDVIDALAQEVTKPISLDPYSEAATPEPIVAEFVADFDAAADMPEDVASSARVEVAPLSKDVPLSEPRSEAVSISRGQFVADRVAPPWEPAANETLVPASVVSALNPDPEWDPEPAPLELVRPLAGRGLALPAATAASTVADTVVNTVVNTVSSAASPSPPPGSFTFAPPAAMAIELPPVSLLARASPSAETVSEQALLEKGQLIEQRLKEFKVPVSVIGADAGPVITRFEIEPAVGVRGSQIVGLMKDLSRALGVTSVRVVETIPGKTCMGLELPNAQRQMIRLSEILESDAYRNHESHLTMAMGKDITGNPVVADLARAPHMLVAGTTGSGKSVAINAMILSLLYKATPEEVRMIMIDPKMLELSVYEGIPHLLAPVVTDMKLAAHALSWCVGEMERRYRLLSALGVRNLAGYNQKIRAAQQAEKYLTNPFSLTPEAPEPLSTLPLIVVIIDELADLMMVAGKKIEELIARLAQKARAAGIHLILATQRPSVDVITGLIKANIPTRVAFQVSSKIDSRTILDQMGAESLLGQGDMLFLPPGTGYPQRVHGAFVADEEVHRVVEYLKQFGEPEYEESILAGPSDENAGQEGFSDVPDVKADPLYDEAVAFVLRSRRASISSVQRQFRIGYNRAARLVEQMESAGLVSSMSNGGTREVLVPGPSE